MKSQVAPEFVPIKLIFRFRFCVVLVGIGFRRPVLWPEVVGVLDFGA